VEAELAERLVGEGFLSYDDLSVIEPDALAEMSGLTLEQVERIIEQAEGKAAQAEKVAAEHRRQQREQERVEAAGAEEEASHPSRYYADGKPAEIIEESASESTGETPKATPAESSDDAAE
jgi:N utilization substance protein A